MSILLIIFSDIRRSADKKIQDVFLQVRGEENPDTNIIIIHFSEDDIARIGPWPIKRNYYALLINQLSSLGVRKIGLEIFLSSRLVTQSVYDNLLSKEIEKSGKVIMSSVAGKITSDDDNFYTDSLSFPSPKILEEKLLTGHINYIYDYDYKIPLQLIDNDIREKAFAYQISELDLKQKYIIVNFLSSWQKIKKYSALEFAGLVYNHSPELNNFKNKIVLIGISDLQIATSIHTPFDDRMPGIGLHAFAIDNLLNSGDYTDNDYWLSILIFPILLLVVIFFRSKIGSRVILIYALSGIILLIISFFIVSELHYIISTSMLVIPFVSVGLMEVILYVIQGKAQLKGVIDEATILRNLLHSKEDELSKLQTELNESGEESVQLVKKIESLRNAIDKLKENEDDRSATTFDGERIEEDFYGIIYSSKSIAQVVELIKKSAPTDSTVLITGESGTGKELVAKAIHSLSKRRDKNFIAVNCGALTDSLLESELFGHMRGSFTGAHTDTEGRFELADEGTIFLDEIGETTENFQVKMLRVLQSGEIEKVGSTKTQKVNVRVVAATNKNLPLLVKEKKFREDLYYRLNVIKIDVPPLRERKEDIEALVKYFIKAESTDITFSKAVLQALNEYQWKGNVRELESVIKRAVIFATSDKRKMIQLSDLPKEIVKETKYSFEDLVLESLRNKNFSRSSIVETARELGDVNRTMISENLRGLVLKSLVENQFNIEKSILEVSGSEDNKVNERVRQKFQTFLKNIENDLIKVENKEFETLKIQFSSKYKNLPVKFHLYLDEVLKWASNSSPK